MLLVGCNDSRVKTIGELRAMRRANQRRAPLTQAECSKLIYRSYELGDYAGWDFENASHRKSALDHDIEECADGDTYERDGYECVMAATSTVAFKACMLRYN